MHLEQTSLMLCTKSMKKMNPLFHVKLSAQELFFDLERKSRNRQNLHYEHGPQTV